MLVHLFLLPNWLCQHLVVAIINRAEFSDGRIESKGGID
jgi:hypothetical protein